MKKISSIFLAVLLSILVSPAWAQYTVIHECDTTVKAKLGSVSLGSRQVKHIVYEYPSTDADGNEVTISGIIMVPSDIADGSVPCDGVVMYNHFTIGSPEDAPSQGGEGLVAPSAMLSNPLKPNYIVVASDYIGYGSSISHDVSYICGDTNGRNSLDGLLAARQLFQERNIPQGKFLFNVGYSQGGTESMYAGRLTDTEAKYKDIRFDKTFAGGGALDFEKIFKTYVENDKCEDLADVVLMIISVNENYHLGIPYDVIFKEPMASKAMEYFKSKKKSVVSEIGVTSMERVSDVLTSEFMDFESEPAKKFMAKVKEIGVTAGWEEPDVTKNYYLAHSRHDNYVPIQSGRGIIPWMRDKGFKPSIVPGKTSLQTCTVIFKLNHQQAGIVWAIQTFAALQAWPVIYYEGEQNRYYHGLVGDLDLMKAIKLIEGLGIDLKKVVQEGGFSRNDLFEPSGSPSRRAKLPDHYTVFDMISGIDNTLSKLGLTTDDLEEMCDDAGITTQDLARAFFYLKSGTDPLAPTAAEVNAGEGNEPSYEENMQALEERVEAALYLQRMYEQRLAAWYMLAGFDVNYSLWGM